MEGNEEGRLVTEREDALLDASTLDVVVLDHDVLLEDLDGVQLIRPSTLRQRNLTRPKNN